MRSADRQREPHAVGGLHRSTDVVANNGTAAPVSKV